MMFFLVNDTISYQLITTSVVIIIKDDGTVVTNIEKNHDIVLN